MAITIAPACHSILRLGALMAALVMCSTHAMAQRYQVQTYGVGDGLPAPGIRDITQDRYGRIWIATQSGPACYDGSAWRKYTLEDGLKSTGLGHIAVDDREVPWVVSHSMPARLATLTDEGWRAIPDGGATSQRNLSTCLAVTGSGEQARAMIGTTNGRMLVWSSKTLEWRTIAAPIPDTKIDAVIMDLTIPGAMGGKQAVQHLKQIDPDVCAIVASGYSNDPVMARASAFGFCAGISKPFGSEELRAVLARALRGRPRAAVDAAQGPSAQTAS